MRACAGSVKLLLANGRVDPNIAEQNGNTALMGAADKGHASVVTLLLADDKILGSRTSPSQEKTSS